MIKRIFDFTAALLGLILLSPMFIAISAIIVVDSRGGVFFRGTRVGQYGRDFKIFKFRSMIPECEGKGKWNVSDKDDRITRTGHFLRKTKLDETANLINIFIGTMSFIGPRPELLQYTEKYEGNEKEILEVRPGITDFSSIEFINLDEIVGSGNADEIYEKHILKRKNALRVKYAETVSFKTDCVIFFKTIGKVWQKSFGYIFKKEHR